MKFSAEEDIRQLTPLWNGERFEDGRPKVSEDILRRMRKITLEEAWGPIWSEGYKFQFQGDFKISHPGTVLVGRAVTAVMVPKRPDLDSTLMNYGITEEGRRGFFNQWVIDSLVEDDVVVIDLFDKIFQGTYVGGNLSTAIATRTKRGGAVIWGGVRDLEQIVKIPNMQTYYRGNDPTGIADVTMTSFNGPTRIGNAICMPGDVVLGTLSGVLFIPPHLAERCVVGAEKSHVRDIFGFARLSSKTYSTAQIDMAWTVAMWEDFINWFVTDPEAAAYGQLSWQEELEEAKAREGKEHAAEVRL
jgi:regulator of RNase E activity RraA